MFERLYERFNARDIDAALCALTRDVDWAKRLGATSRGTTTSGTTGHGNGPRSTGRSRPKDSQLNPLGRIDVTVRQRVKNFDGELLEDATVHHIYRLRRGQVEHMEIRR